MSETYWQGEADKLHAKWIKALTDLETLKAENERLREASFVTAIPSEQYEKLKTENERLRKAGDAMKHWIVWKGYDFPGVNDWSAAAKEGRDAK